MWQNKRTAVRRKEVSKKTKTGKRNRAKQQKESWKKTKKSCWLSSLWLPPPE